MTVPKHLENAASRLEEAYWRVDLARKKPLTKESLQEWLAALTDATRALADIELANNESIHEKLHQLAQHVSLPAFGAVASRRGRKGRVIPGGRHDRFSTTQHPGRV